MQLSSLDVDGVLTKSQTAKLEAIAKSQGLEWSNVIWGDRPSSQPKRLTYYHEGKSVYGYTDDEEDKVTGVVLWKSGDYIDFANCAIETVKIEYRGSRTEDFKEADRLAKIDEKKRTGEGWVWHHFADYKGKRGTMQLVPWEIHFRHPHWGGVSQAKADAKAVESAKSKGDAWYGTEYG